MILQVIESHIEDYDTQEVACTLLGCLSQNMYREEGALLLTTHPLSLLAAFQKVLYCFRDCQKEDYKLHKMVCKQLASLDNGSKSNS